MIYLLGISINFFLSFILLTKKDKSIADKILLAWLIVTLLHLIMVTLIFTKEYTQFPYFLGLELPIPLLYGPFLFLYSKALSKGEDLAKNNWLHLIPYGIAFLFTLPFLILNPAEKIRVYQNDGLGYVWLTNIIFGAIVISGITYSILSFRLLRRYKKMINENYSYTEKINLQWLSNLILGMSGIWLVVLFAKDEQIFAAVVLYVVFIGYYGIKQVGVFTNSSPALAPLSPIIAEPQVLSPPLPEKVKYERTSLPNTQLDEIQSDLNQLMQQQKLFCTPELTLTMVAQALDVHPNTLSQVINRAEGKNFFDYINSLRVAEFKEKVAKPENQKYTLLALAYECGFNSKTSFNRNFKKSTGKSPTEYLKASKISLHK